jgi:hypothetical protein
MCTSLPALGETLSRAEALRRAPLLGQDADLDAPLCDGDERRAGVGVPARMAADLDRQLPHDHVRRALRTDREAGLLEVERVERGSAEALEPELQAGRRQDGPHKHRRDASDETQDAYQSAYVSVSICPPPCARTPRDNASIMVRFLTVFTSDNLQGPTF